MSADREGFLSPKEKIVSTNGTAISMPEAQKLRSSHPMSIVS